jgi:hypothetical protein
MAQTKQSVQFMQLLDSICQHYCIDLYIPSKILKGEGILYGSGTKNQVLFRTG